MLGALLMTAVFVTSACVPFCCLPVAPVRVDEEHMKFGAIPFAHK